MKVASAFIICPSYAFQERIVILFQFLKLYFLFLIVLNRESISGTELSSPKNKLEIRRGEQSQNRM